MKQTREKRLSGMRD